MNRANILITGAAGFIGSHLIKSYVERDCNVYCLVRKTTPTEHLRKLKVKFIYGDVTDRTSLSEAVKGKDYIYHLASTRYPREIRTYYEVNQKGTENLIQTCLEKNNNIKKFIYVSSLAAAGPSSQGKPLKETDVPSPVTHYGKSKLLAEKAVLEHKQRLPVLILRPPVVYGFGNMFFDYLFAWLKKGLKPIVSGYTSLCYIKDFVNGVIVAGESPKTNSKIFFISDGDINSWKKIMDVLVGHMGRKNFLEIYIPHHLILGCAPFLLLLCRILKKPHVGNKITEMKFPYWTCCDSKIRQEIGYKNEFDLGSGMDDWFKDASLHQGKVD